MGETRPVPPELAHRGEVRVAGGVLVALVAGFIIAIPYWFGTVTILRFAAPMSQFS